MRYLIILFIVAYITPVSAQLHQQLYARYDAYKEISLSDRRFKPEDIQALLRQLDNNFATKEVGQSVEGRPISLVTYGNGPVQILLWSQMHGDEPTATQALMDIFRWLSSSNDGFDTIREKIKKSMTLHVIPMLNPDGAMRFVRRNYHDIDINRDALRLQTPEGRILKHIRDSLKADWGFNLHDQGRGTSVAGKAASVSLLAPAFNENRDINKSRGDAMKLVRYIYDRLQSFIPNQVGIYPDDFEPRAFGDNIQKWGTRTVLVESGGFQQDFERQEVRKLNFVLIISALESIASSSYKKIAVKKYNEIPKNASRRLHELLLLNVNIEGLIRDAAFDRRETQNITARHYYATGYVSDLGDLRTSVAFNKFDASGMVVQWGKLYPTVFNTVNDLQQADLFALLKLGFTDFVVREPVDKFSTNISPQVNIHNTMPAVVETLRLGSNPSLVFKVNDVVKAVVVNGQLIRLDN
ncbi:MAG: peptidase M14 [Cyclobacteriaceae bacterium]|nr:peptidase M14 [Cyclobacteriaceae bacterium]